MIIEVGKKYIDRKGKIVKIVEKYDCENFLGNNCIVYRASGKFSDRKDTECDLIKEE
jgi:hypothetical protein